jgi:hypothetical protein
MLALALLLLTPHVTPAQTRPIWQVDEGASIKLGVRDKFSVLGRYSATFIVTAPNGKKFYKSIDVEGDQWGDVVYPDDFKQSRTVATSGLHTWECVVNGEIALRGKFSLNDSLSLRKRK